MKRRTFTILSAATALGRPLAARAQQPAARAYRLGLLSSGPALAPESEGGAALLGVLAGHGFVLGRNLVLVARSAGADRARLPALVEELKAGDGVDVVLTMGFPAAKAARDGGLPRIVAINTGDPVATGLIASMARPGGTLTGISDEAITLSVKRLSLLAELLPRLRRVAMLWNRDDLGMSTRFQASAKAAQAMGVAVQALGVREPNDFDGAFEAMDRDPPDAILMVSDALTILNRKRVIDYAVARRLPAIYETESVVSDGGLMSYGGDRIELFERAAALIDRLFRGANPGELPFELPTRYRFVVNLKAAQALGLAIPPTLLARADEVIE
jgi:putative tryptophan/tyrosine transport system substrate-binding protein